MENVTGRCSGFRGFESPLEGGEVTSVVSDFLRVLREQALMALALGAWVCGNKTVAPTRQTWSRHQLPEIPDEATCPDLPVKGRSMHKVVSLSKTDRAA